MTLRASLAVIDVLMEMNWLLVKFKQPCLITSDSPVSLISTRPSRLPMVGFKTADEVWFPLTADTLLTMSHSKSGKAREAIGIMHEAMDKEAGDHYQEWATVNNQMQISVCFKEAYGQDALLEKFRQQELRI